MQFYDILGSFWIPSLSSTVQLQDEEIDHMDYGTVRNKHWKYI
jgi:hypothetical protein